MPGVAGWNAIEGGREEELLPPETSPNRSGARTNWEQADSVQKDKGWETDSGSTDEVTNGIQKGKVGGIKSFPPNLAHVVKHRVN